MEQKNYLKNQTIYQVYVRNHTKEGTFKALEKDLDRIASLGVDILYLLPIHPLGKKERKGTLGSPYAISDYYAINEELGNLEDFKTLLNAAHKLGLQVMIDIVLHHTSPDAVLLKEHPDFYFYKNGKLGNKVGDWSDIIDLDYTNLALWDYMVSMLAYWASLGVDGFRADVAPLIPLKFWKYVRTKLDEKYPNLLLLSESVEPGFLAYLRENGHVGHSDKEMYEAFDMLYDYDVYPDFKAYLEDKTLLNVYLDGVKAQQDNYPKGYLKIRTIENHDTSRIASLCQHEQQLYNVTAWSFFLDGVGFIYAGQEGKATHRPTLFDKDTIVIPKEDEPFYHFISELIKIKKMDIFSNSEMYQIINIENSNVVQVKRKYRESLMLGYFNFSREEVIINTSLDDGVYNNLLGGLVTIINGRTIISGPIILYFQ